LSKHILITGGAGFIGSNLVRHHAVQGNHVTVLDDLSRTGSERNLKWIQERRFENVHIVRGSICDAETVTSLFEENHFDLVVHCASQVAVTLSVQNPVYDHRVNDIGTLNMLEGLRNGKNPKAFFILPSTNKVYGGLEGLAIVELETRYQLQNAPNGITERVNLDFHSPYGCSKGAADQYTRDYARIYGLNTVVFRQSCIYGPQQVGITDQGWVAWFVRVAMAGKPITVFGDGKQTRDLLYIDDLIRAYDQAELHAAKTRGQIYNIGGGPDSARSVLEVLKVIKKSFPDLTWNYEDWRPGDQRAYVSDISKAKRDFGWSPQVSSEDGIAKLIEWCKQERATLPPV
jgi:CDP-paratose 2-epimerase